MKAVIFGANGQDGFYLAEILRREAVEAVKISRSGANLIGDVADQSFVESVVKNQQPDYIFHLAANSTTAHDAVYENHQTIATGTLNILEAAAKGVFSSIGAPVFSNCIALPDKKIRLFRLCRCAASKMFRVPVAIV